jgi:hypothetical protein
MTDDARTPEQIRGELDAERTELAGAVEQLRGEIDDTLKKKLPIAAGAAASVGLALAATKRYFARRRD